MTISKPKLFGYFIILSDTPLDALTVNNVVKKENAPEEKYQCSPSACTAYFWPAIHVAKNATRIKVNPYY
jgi:hypothetical protein